MSRTSRAKNSADIVTASKFIYYPDTQPFGAVQERAAHLSFVSRVSSVFLKWRATCHYTHSISSIGAMDETGAYNSSGGATSPTNPIVSLPSAKQQASIGDKQGIFDERHFVING